MSSALKDFTNSSAAKLALAAVISFGSASNASAALPEVGQCAPAQDVIAQLPTSGYSPLLAFDRSMLTNQGEKVFRRNSIVANSNLTTGFYFVRNNKDEICNDGRLNDIVLADNRERKIDPRTISSAPKADGTNGINSGIRHSASKANQYPVIQAKVTNAEGEQGLLTITANPDTREGGLMFSKASGVLVREDTLESGEINGKKYGVQYSSVALATLDKMKVAQAPRTEQTSVLAALAPPRP